MKILVLNSGSTSLKYKLFQLPNFKILAENYFPEIKDHVSAVKQALREIGDLRDIAAVGHRVVHGGKKFTEPIVVTPAIFEQLSHYNHLAPLHNPYNLAGIKAVSEYLAKIPNVAVFDTMFYKDLPAKTKFYAIPWELSERYEIQRFGFHGLSHAYAAEEAAKKLNIDFAKINLITVHLGGGASITAIEKGKAIDTSMGFTPMEGLVMMTRGGDLGAGVVLKLCQIYYEKNPDQACHAVDDLLNHQSGIKGVSGISNYLDLLKEMSLGNSRARLAFDMFIYRIQKYIGAYFAILGQVDGVVFTGAIGSGNPITRKKVCQNLKILEGVNVMAIKTNEEEMAAREVRKLLRED